MGPISNLMYLAASRALDRGMQFVVAKQGGDGLWRDFLTPAGEASSWPSGFIGAALHLAGAETGVLQKALVTLIANQGADGGWGYNESTPSDADSTACALLFLARMGHKGDVCERAASCLVRHQRHSGGVATYHEPGPIRRFMDVGRWMRFKGWCHPHIEVTAMAGRALAALSPEDWSSEIDAAWRYVKLQQRAEGNWNSYWWTSPHYSTLQAVELASFMRDESCIGRAAEAVVQCQSEHGDWAAPGAATSAFATALSLSILLCAKGHPQQVSRAVQRLVELQDDDGGWPSHPIMRIPLPGTVDPDRPQRWLFVSFAGGIVVRDQNRTFTSAACLTALAQAKAAMG